jgi:hypothetical protein
MSDEAKHIANRLIAAMPSALRARLVTQLDVLRLRPQMILAGPGSRCATPIFRMPV